MCEKCLLKNKELELNCEVINKIKEFLDKNYMWGDNDKKVEVPQELSKYKSMLLGYMAYEEINFPRYNLAHMQEIYKQDRRAIISRFLKLM